MDEIINILRKDDVMNNVIDTVGECKIGKNKQTFFAYLIGLIIGQKIKFATARVLRKKMYLETKSYDFTPQDILNLSNNQFDKIGVGVNIKKIIIDVANYFVLNDNITKNNILDLKKINGIGDWTISTIIIEYGIDINLFPLGDKHVNKKLKELYNIEKKDIAMFVETWNPYKSVAFWYLWKYDLKY